MRARGQRKAATVGGRFSAGHSLYPANAFHRCSGARSGEAGSHPFPDHCGLHAKPMELTALRPSKPLKAAILDPGSCRSFSWRERLDQMTPIETFAESDSAHALAVVCYNLLARCAHGSFIGYG